MARKTPVIRPRARSTACLLLLVIAVGLNIFSQPTSAADGPIRELNDAEKTAALCTPFGLAAISRFMPYVHADSGNYSRERVNALDRWWRERIHGGNGYKTNFVDNKFGSLIAPLSGGLTMALLDIDRREFSRDIPYFVSGAVATGALTTFAKKLIRHPRPYMLPGGVMPPNRARSDPYHIESFLSGHTSQAFFAAGFVNNRLRRHMRQEWTREEYRSWRWTSPLITFGWAGFVGWSRMHADKHHFSDVVAGALLGYAISEVYYRLAYAPGETTAESSLQGTPMFSMSIRF